MLLKEFWRTLNQHGRQSFAGSLREFEMDAAPRQFTSSSAKLGGDDGCHGLTGRMR
jgi:hypothetical protein